jgi:hypothetical protein
MPDGLLERIVRESGVPDLVEVLAQRLAPTDLQSLMMEVYRRRSALVSPAELLERFGADRFSRPATTAPPEIAAFEQLAWSLLPEGYEPVELSPLCPLGTNSVIATVDQHKVVSTSRNNEVVADSTAVLALACALRRRHLLSDHVTRSQVVSLAASQRQVRAQDFGKPGSSAHFRLLGVASAGRDRGSLGFETDALVTQISFFVTMLDHHWPGRRTRVAVTDLCDRSDLWERQVLQVLSDRFSNLAVEMDASRQSGRGYYIDACYKVYVVDPAGDEVECGDGGCTGWTRHLLSNNKERLVIGGMGIERLLGQKRTAGNEVAGPLH